MRARGCTLQELVRHLQDEVEVIEGARNEDEYGNQVRFFQMKTVVPAPDFLVFVDFSRYCTNNQSFSNRICEILGNE